VSVFAVLAALTASAVIGVRVFAPAETVVPATAPYPDRPAITATRYGELAAAPLIVDGRLRIFAEARRVWADTPITERSESTPYWSYRRWPAKVAGVVEVDSVAPGIAVVIVKYTDGMVVALDPHTGRPVWRDQARASERDRFEGRRTGAATVYQPAGLFTARSSSDGSPIVVVAGADQVLGYDPWTGRRVWEQVFTEHPGCHDTDWTGETTYVAKDSCAAPAVLQVFDAGTGRPVGKWQPPGASAGPAEEANWYAEPTSCVRGFSGCGLIRAAALPEVTSDVKLTAGLAGVPARIWRLNHDGTISPERYARTDHPFVLGETLVEEEFTGQIHTISRLSGQVVWRTTEPLRLVAVNHTGVYAITRDYRLIVLHPVTGVELSRTDLRRNPGDEWKVGFVHVAGRFVAVERVTGAGSLQTDEQYYYGVSPVVTAGV
jgi:outer membrane protein assembly factor BamB